MSTVLIAKTRHGKTRSSKNLLRQQGAIPAVVYGYQVENTPIYVNGSELLKTIREVGRNGLITMDLEGKTINVMLHEYQEDPIKKNLLHVDFLSVDPHQEIEATVALQLVGEEENNSGGVVQLVLSEITVVSRPDQLVDFIELDVKDLEIGDTIKIGDIRGNYPFTIEHDDDETLVTVTAPTASLEEEEVEEEEDSEEGAEAEEE